MGIYTPDVHPHGFASKGIDPVQLKSAIAAATKAASAAPNAEERKLNDFGASPVERFNAAHPLYVTPVAATAGEAVAKPVPTDGELRGARLKRQSATDTTTDSIEAK